MRFQSAEPLMKDQAMARERSASVGVILAAFALAVAFSATNVQLSRASSFEADWRPIVLKGGALTQLLGRPESHFEVLALHDGRLEAIPFQIDAVQPDGHYALSDGSQPTSARGTDVLERDDELAMMLSDLGERASPKDLPSGALEIEAFDPAEGVRRYAYIAAVPSPRRSPLSYVSYDSTHERIEGETYRLTLRGDFPIALELKNHGKLSSSIVEGTQVQATARVLVIFRLHLSAKGVKNRLVGWRGGPVRVIRRVSHSMKRILSIQPPPVLSDEIFYGESAEDSFSSYVPWIPRLFFSDVTARAWLDFVGLENFAISSTNADWLPLRTGAQRAALAAEVRRRPPDASWIALRGEGRLLIQTFAPSPELTTLRRRLYFERAAPTEASHRPTGSDKLEIGYLITGWEDLAPGMHGLDSMLIVLSDRASPHTVAQEIEAPPQLNVSECPNRARPLARAHR
jgi:hypothetical protein